MPSRAIANGKTVTLRLDAHLVLDLKMTALQSGIGLSELIGSCLAGAVEDGTIKRLAGLPAAPSIKKPAAAKPIHESPKVPSAPKPAKPSVGGKGAKKVTGDRELFQHLEDLKRAGKLRYTALMKAVAPDISPENYGASWKKTGHVPAPYIEAVKAYLKEHGLEMAPVK
jgi:hypothetical protein